MIATVTVDTHTDKQTISQSSTNSSPLINPHIHHQIHQNYPSFVQEFNHIEQHQDNNPNKIGFYSWIKQDNSILNESSNNTNDTNTNNKHIQLLLGGKQSANQNYYNAEFLYTHMDTHNQFIQKAIQETNYNWWDTNNTWFNYAQSNENLTQFDCNGSSSSATATTTTNSNTPSATSSPSLKESTTLTKTPLTKAPRSSGRSPCDCPNCQEADSLGPEAGAQLKKRNFHSCHIAGCGKVYNKTSHLKAHLRWHTG